MKSKRVDNESRNRSRKYVHLKASTCQHRPSSDLAQGMKHTCGTSTSHLTNLLWQHQSCPCCPTTSATTLEYLALSGCLSKRARFEYLVVKQQLQHSTTSETKGGSFERRTNTCKSNIISSTGRGTRCFLYFIVSLPVNLVIE